MSPQELRAARRRFGLSQHQFAARLHCAVATLQGWETGQRPMSVEVQYRIARLIVALMHSPWVVDTKLPCPQCAGAGMVPAVYNEQGQLIPATPWEGPRNA